jgi:hypothetical protein
MKNVKLAIAALVISATSFMAFNVSQTASIKGKISPAQSSEKAWALSSSDTLQAPITNGEFSFSNVKAGTYQIIIEAKAPYKNTAKNNIEVKDGGVTDVGEIVVNQ